MLLTLATLVASTIAQMSTASVAAKPVSIIANTCRIGFKLGKTPEIIISRNFIVTHQSF